MTLWNETKSIPISHSMIWSAYKKVKANKGSAGVDSVSMEEFDANRRKHLYKLWNRMASGSYFPPPVKEVEPSDSELMNTTKNNNIMNKYQRKMEKSEN